MVMTDVNYNQKMAFTFLDELRSKFVQKYSKEEIRTARSHSVNTFNGIYNTLVVNVG